jgi:hypothetical protein
MNKKVLKLISLLGSILVFVSCFSAFSSNLNSNSNISDKNQKSQKILKVQLADRNELGIEPLMIRGLVIKKIPQKNIILVRIVSETYRNRIIAIEGNLQADKGQYVEGYLNKNKFAPIGRRQE